MHCHLHGAILAVDTWSHSSFAVAIHHIQLLEERYADVPVDNTLPLTCFCIAGDVPAQKMSTCYRVKMHDVAELLHHIVFV